MPTIAIALIPPLKRDRDGIRGRGRGRRIQLAEPAQQVERTDESRGRIEGELCASHRRNPPQFLRVSLIARSSGMPAKQSRGEIRAAQRRRKDAGGRGREGGVAEAVGERGISLGRAAAAVSVICQAIIERSFAEAA